MKIRQTLILLLLGGVSSPAWSGTCALCRKVLEEGGGAGLIKGYYWSILLITAVPLIVLGFGIYHLRRYW